MLRCRAHTETPICSYREPLPWATALANASPTASTTSSTVPSGICVVSSSPRLFWRMMLPCASSTGPPNFTRLCVLTAIHSFPFMPLVQYYYRRPPGQDHRLSLCGGRKRGGSALDTAQPDRCKIASMDAETQVEAPFGEWLLRKLRERDMSLSDVARLAQCDYTYLWRLVNVGRARGRQYRRPSYAMAERVGRALGATHEALTAAGYLPAENVQNSRVVDALDRVERQLCRLREELSKEEAPPDGGSERQPRGASSRALPLLDGASWPADPDAAMARIE